MRRKFYCPVSGVSRGTQSFRGPYRNVGKYHHRRDLLFIPQWGRMPEKIVSRAEFPQGNTYAWQAHAARAWPIKQNYEAQLLYRINEKRYIAPALRAKDPGIKSYLMNQLDPSARSGIGIFNVQGSSTTSAANRSTNLMLSDKEINALPDGFPKHIIATLNVTHTDVMLRMLQHSIRRQPIPLLNHCVQEAQQHIFAQSRKEMQINPLPRIQESHSIIKPLKKEHILSINRRYRPNDNKKSPIWRHRQHQFRQSKRQFEARKKTVAYEEKLHFIRLAKRSQIAATEV